MEKLMNLRSWCVSMLLMFSVLVLTALLSSPAQAAVVVGVSTTPVRVVVPGTVYRGHGYSYYHGYHTGAYYHGGAYHNAYHGGGTYHHGSTYHHNGTTYHHGTTVHR